MSHTERALDVRDFQRLMERLGKVEKERDVLREYSDKLAGKLSTAELERDEVRAELQSLREEYQRQVALLEVEFGFVSGAKSLRRFCLELLVALEGK